VPAVVLFRCKVYSVEGDVEMRKSDLYSAIVVLGAVLFWIGAGAQNDLNVHLVGTMAAHAESAPLPVNAAERNFLKTAAQNNMAEVMMGKLGVKRAASAEVREFAEKMVADHGKTLTEIKSLAAKSGVTLPTNVRPEHAAKHKKLSALSRAEFDAAFVKEMVGDHRKAVATWQARANSGSSSAVTDWVASKLPTLRHHLHMALELHDNINR
jgi:putative membrane protein